MALSLGSGITDPEFGDVEFVFINDEKGKPEHLYAQKYILSKRCDYFGSCICSHYYF